MNVNTSMLATILVAIPVLGALAGVVIYMIKKRKRGGCISCSGGDGCANCSYCAGQKGQDQSHTLKGF